MRTIAGFIAEYEGQKLEHFPSLVHTQATLLKKKWPGIHCSRMCKNYGRGSVNVSMNGLSHMPRNSMATVYDIVSERLKKNRISTTEMAVKLSKTACNYLLATIMAAVLISFLDTVSRP